MSEYRDNLPLSCSKKLSQLKAVKQCRPKNVNAWNYVRIRGIIGKFPSSICLVGQTEKICFVIPITSKN